MNKRLARVHLIYKNPRYKVVQKDSKYLLIDLEQHWYSYLFPMLNWIIPIKYIELTYEEYNSLNIIPSNKHYGNSILASGITVIISVFFEKIYNFNEYSYNACSDDYNIFNGINIYCLLKNSA
ncbi:DUF443 family protein [Staphylococcus pettenkoferi]|uniref:DUF443 family protein n=1 Tax=Staphylococcus pettenkoferi TaxID=170573 RepID=UPI00398C26B2